MRKNRTIAILLFLVILLMLVPTVLRRTANGATGGSAVPSNRQVLVLNGWHPGNPWTDEITSGIQKELSAASEAAGAGTDIYVEYLDLARFPDLRMSAVTRISQKYASNPPDAVICTDRLAESAWKRSLSADFGGALVVCCSGAESRMTELTDQSVKETVILARLVNPMLREVAILDRDGADGASSAERWTGLIRGLDGNLSVRDLSDLSPEHVLAACAKMDRDTMVLFGRFSGQDLEETAFASLLTEMSKAPAYGFYSHLQASGLIGGAFLSGERIGAAAADKAMQFDGAIPAGDESVVDAPVTVRRLDWQQLRRYQLDSGRIPAEIEIVNKPESGFSSIPAIAAAASLVLAALLGAMLLLYMRIRRSKRSEAALKERVERLESQRRELKDSRERYRLVAEASRDIIWEWDVERNALHFPERWLAEFGLESDAVLSMQDWLRRIEPENRESFGEMLDAHLKGHSDVFEMQVQMRDGRGDIRHLSVSGKALVDENGAARRMAGSINDVTVSISQQQRITELAYLDALTDLPNKTMLKHLLEEAVNELAHPDDRLALIYLDVDNFKLINDSFGHQTGDCLLVELAQRMREFAADAQWVARLGGDEFAVLLPFTEGDDPVESYCARLRELFKGSFRVDGHQFQVSVSIGVSLYPTDGTAFDDLLMNADTALNHAKSQRGDRVARFRKSMNDAVMNKVKMQSDLRRAFDNHELQLYYQAKYSVAERRICGFEALLRWQSADGVIPPSSFIGTAEETGLIIPIGEWVIREACRFLQRLGKAGHDDVSVSVNVSVLQLTQGSLAETIRACIGESGITPDRFAIEITESVLMENYEESILTLSQIRRLGVRIELDDFGNGYSSLGYLKQMPLHTLKIDKSFVDAIDREAGTTPLTDTIIQLGHQLGLEVVAEGVEHAWQYDALCRGKCDVLQGYLLSRPVPERQAVMLLERTLDDGRNDLPGIAGAAAGAGDVIPFRKRER